ncbi:MAG: hypothetical protein Q7R35_15810, partial [Elusimicrobiota bacterium]|nr:hypothetical protein [Elusimicrobiota bacterium]
MKRFAGLLSLIVLNVVPFAFPAAQPAPALDTLNDSAAGFSLSAPAPEAPLLYNADRTPQDSLAGEQLFAYLHEATAPAPRRAPS